jgi:hypothetical protein
MLTIQIHRVAHNEQDSELLTLYPAQSMIRLLTTLNAEVLLENRVNLEHPAPSL